MIAANAEIGGVLLLNLKFASSQREGERGRPASNLPEKRGEQRD